MSSEKQTTDPSIIAKMSKSLGYGSFVMFSMAPGLNAFNAVAIRALKERVSSASATQLVYNGTVDGTPGIHNFGTGLTEHLRKESGRIVGKSVGLFVLYPWLKENMSQGKADLTFAGLMSAYELLVNPFDQRRVCRQANLTPPPVLSSEAFTGSLGNVKRQFATWYGFKASGTKLNEILEDKTDIDPHSVKGILVKGPFQALAYTLPSYPIEVITRGVQFNTENRRSPVTIITDTAMSVSNGEIPKSAYADSAKKLMSRNTAANALRAQGTRGKVILAGVCSIGELYQGFGAKFCYNTCLAWGAQGLIELGLGTFKPQQQEFEYNVGLLFTSAFSRSALKPVEKRFQEDEIFR